MGKAKAVSCRHCCNKYSTISSIAFVVFADERIIGVPPDQAVRQVTAGHQSRPGGCRHQSCLDGKLLQGYFYSTECLENQSC